MGCAVFVVVLTIGFWQFMIPMFGFAALVVLYLRYTRGSDSL